MARRFSPTSEWVTLSLRFRGKVTRTRVPSPRARTRSVAPDTVSGRTSWSQSGQWVRPTRAQRSRR